jgi:hypothetical protein
MREAVKVAEHVADAKIVDSEVVWIEHGRQSRRPSGVGSPNPLSGTDILAWPPLRLSAHGTVERRVLA